jgi:hypothetical protein
MRRRAKVRARRGSVRGFINVRHRASLQAAFGRRDEAALEIPQRCDAACGLL